MHSIHYMCNVVGDKDGKGGPEMLVIGGTNALPGIWKWQGSLVEPDIWTGRLVHVCGVVLIREDYVLTAAHCVNPDK